jgi:hypothetical protein
MFNLLTLSKLLMFSTFTFASAFKNGSNLSVSSQGSVPDLMASYTCRNFDWIRYNEWITSVSIPNRRQTHVAVTEIFETIESFGPSTIYTACDGITHFRFLSRPTRSQRRTVTVVQTLVKTYVPGGEKTFFVDVPCNSTAALERRDEEFGTETCSSENLSYFDGIASTGLGNIAFSQSLPSIPCIAITSCEMVMMDEEVILIYWPPESTRNGSCTPNDYLNGTRKSTNTLEKCDPILVFTTDAITFRGQDLYHLTMIDTYRTLTTTSNVSYITPSVLKGPFTFTSPTMYLAHKPISAKVDQQLVLQTKNGSTNLRVRSMWTSLVLSAGSSQ